MNVGLIESGDLVRFDNAYYVVLSICFDENNCILSSIGPDEITYGGTHTVLTRCKSCEVILKSYSLFVGDLY